jgi:hypothetical protein
VRHRGPPRAGIRALYAPGVLSPWAPPARSNARSKQPPSALLIAVIAIRPSRFTTFEGTARWPDGALHASDPHVFQAGHAPGVGPQRHLDAVPAYAATSIGGTPGFNRQLIPVAELLAAIAGENLSARARELAASPGHGSASAGGNWTFRANAGSQTGADLLLWLR